MTFSRQGNFRIHLFLLLYINNLIINDYKIKKIANNILLVHSSLKVMGGKSFLMSNYTDYTYRQVISRLQIHNALLHNKAKKGAVLRILR